MIVRELLELLRAFPETALVEIADEVPEPHYCTGTDTVQLWPKNEIDPLIDETKCSRCHGAASEHYCENYSRTFEPATKR